MHFTTKRLLDDIYNQIEEDWAGGVSCEPGGIEIKTVQLIVL